MYELACASMYKHVLVAAMFSKAVAYHKHVTSTDVATLLRWEPSVCCAA
jgi:hypothetical protein